VIEAKNIPRAKKLLNSADPYIEISLVPQEFVDRLGVDTVTDLNAAPTNHLQRHWRTVPLEGSGPMPGSGDSKEEEPVIKTRTSIKVRSLMSHTRFHVFDRSPCFGS
jgi:hypothetical protein